MFEKIISLLSDPNKYIRLNIVQLIGSLAQHPEGRSKAQDCVKTLQKLTDVDKIYI